MRDREEEEWEGRRMGGIKEGLEVFEGERERGGGEEVKDRKFLSLVYF